MVEYRTRLPVQIVPPEFRKYSSLNRVTAYLQYIDQNQISMEWDLWEWNVTLRFEFICSKVSINYSPFR